MYWAPAVVALLAGATFSPSALAAETSPAAAETLPANTEFSLDQDDKERQTDRADIEKILNNIEDQWNAHNLDTVMDYYSEDYINNDGLDKKAVTALTQDFWKTYPDAKSFSKVKQIRIEGNFATVESRDMATGSTAKEIAGIPNKGDLKSISEGQLYMKKLGHDWKIIGDRIDYEKVRVAFGIAKTLKTTFSAPEQVKSGRQYSAKLEVDLPANVMAYGEITSEPLEYPQVQPKDAYKQIDGPVLERLLPANTSNHNELLMATLAVTNPGHASLLGLEFLTRRLNVVPEMPDSEVATNQEDKDHHHTSSTKEKEKSDAGTKSGKTSASAAAAEKDKAAQTKVDATTSKRESTPESPPAPPAADKSDGSK
jgi:ketosteroid isomerase-like protein